MISVDEINEALKNVQQKFDKDADQFSSLLQEIIRQKEVFIKVHGGIKLNVLQDILIKLLDKLTAADMKILDSWLIMVISTIDTKDLQTNSGFTSYLFEMGIKHKLQSVTNYLIDHDLGLQTDIPNNSGEKGYRALFYVLEDQSGFDKALFDKLLAKEKDINHASSFGQTALYLATETGNQYAIDRLLEREDIKIHGSFLGATVFDLAKYDTILFKKLVDRLNKDFIKHDYTWAELINFPIAELDTQNQEFLSKKLYKQISELEIFDDKELKAAFLKFIEDKTPLPFARLNRLAIAIECMSYLVNFGLVNQHKTNVCGAAVLMQHMIMCQPKLFIYSAMELAELSLPNKQPNKFLPARVKSIPKEMSDLSFNLSSLWMETIRHHYNVITGYSAQSKWEVLYGLTTPYQLALMFNDFNYEILSESMQVQFDPKQRFGSFLESARKMVASYGVFPAPLKVYGGLHKEFKDDAQRFGVLCEWSEKHPDKPVSILINQDLLNLLIGYCRDNDNFNLKIEFTHYINVSNLVLSPDKKNVSFDFFTFGQTFHAKNINVDDFKNGYRGALCVVPKLAKEYVPTLLSNKSS